MLITRKHPFTGHTNTKDLPVTLDELRRWQSGELAQNVWPNLLADDREFLISGITEWDKYCPPDVFIERGVEEIPIVEPQQADIKPKEEEKWIIPEFGIIHQDVTEMFAERLAANNDGIPIPTQPEYRPPSSRIYSTSNVSAYKFHKLRPILKYLNENIYLAGGSLRTILKCSGELVSDFDFFFKSFEEVQKLRDKLTADDWSQTYECPQGFLYTYKKGNHKLQLICETEYSSPNLLVSSFDVSACMCCWHCGVLTFTREFVRSVKTKNLRTCNVTFPVATIKRLIKYAQKGYNCSVAAEDFCRQISGKSFENDQFRHYID